MKETIKIQSFLSPCGELSLGSYGGKLCLCNWQNSRRREAVEKRISRYLQAEFENGESDITDKTARQLNEYFEGKRTKFNIPLLLVGTDFQQLVWNGLLKICFGQKCSYADLARQINSPNAVRAVANANACQCRFNSCPLPSCNWKR
jgi:methylated-DNA-[protein]-cysteine S-methyltransferase